MASIYNDTAFDEINKDINPGIKIDFEKVVKDEIKDPSIIKDSLVYKKKGGSSSRKHKRRSSRRRRRIRITKRRYRR